MKTFDLSKKYNFDNDVQKNIKKLYKKFGKRFNIKYKKNMIPVKLYKKVYKETGNSFYVLEYYLKKQYEELKPFQILFYDESSETFDKNDITYIGNIHRTEEISGSTMVKFVIELQKKLKVKKTTLYDGATVYCNDQKIDLSFFKLIEKKRTFYQKFGFKFSTDGIYQLRRIQYGSKENFQKIMNKCIDKFRKIKVSEYLKLHKQIVDLINIIIKKQDYKKVEIISKSNIYSKQYQIEKELLEQIQQSNNIIKILSDTKKVYLYQLLIELLKKGYCHYYNDIMEYIIKNNLYKIKYKSKTIIFNNLELFKIIFQLRQNSRFELEL